MPGDPASLAKAAERLSKTRSKLDEYENRLGLPPLPTSRDECEALSLTGEEISKLAPERRDEYAADLAAYAVYIQRTLSKERGLARWLEARINLAVAGDLQTYVGYYSHDQRRAVAILNNVYAKELEEFRINSQLKIDVLDGLVYQINQMSRILHGKGRTWQG